jgi:hypothetical protein
MCESLFEISISNEIHAWLKPREEKLYTRETTQIYLHVVKKPGLGVRSPLDVA